MIQLDKEFLFNDQLKFNLDSSTPMSSKYGFSSPGVIMIQKLTSQPKAKAITTNKVHLKQPISNKLSFAMKVAKLDASDYLKKKSSNAIDNCTKKKGKVKNIVSSDLATNQSKSKPRVITHPLKQHKLQHHAPPPFKCFKIPKNVHFDGTSSRQPNFMPSSETWLPKASVEKFTSVRDACTSTCDLSKTQCAVEPKCALRQSRKATNSITKAKLKNNYVQKTPKDVGVPYYLSPQKDKSFTSPNPVKQKVLVSKNIERPNQNNIKQKKNRMHSKKAYERNIPNKALPKQFDHDEFDLSYCDDVPKVKAAPKIGQLEKPFHSTDEQIRSMYERLLDIEDLERNIRSRWVEIKYDRLRKCEQKPVPVQCCNALENPAVLDISGGHQNTLKPKKEPFRFVSKKRDIDSPGLHFTNIPSLKKAQKSLFLPTKTVESVYRNKSKFSDYLRRTLHEPKGRFDPWSVVDELSDEIVHLVLKDVCNEVSDDFDGCIERLFESEFANPGDDSQKSCV